MVSEALGSPACSASESLCSSDDGRKQNSAIEKESYGNMSRKTLVTLLLIIVSALLAVALFIAGAIWRGRVFHKGDSKPMPALERSRV